LASVSPGTPQDAVIVQPNEEIYINVARHPRDLAQAQSHITAIAIKKQDSGVGKKLPDPSELPGVLRRLLSEICLWWLSQTSQIKPRYLFIESAALSDSANLARRFVQWDLEIST
jgi:hypothetical protein